MAGETMNALAKEYGVAVRTAQIERHRAEGSPPKRLGRRRQERVAHGAYWSVHVDPSDPIAVTMQFGSTSKYVLEHRLVVAHRIGRALLSTETVHHRDGNGLNNHTDNLELRIGQHGKGATHAHCGTCTCFPGGE